MTLIIFLINQLFRNFTGQLILTPLTSRSCLNYSCWNLAGTFRMLGLYWNINFHWSVIKTNPTSSYIANRYPTRNFFNSTED